MNKQELLKVLKELYKKYDVNPPRSKPAVPKKMIMEIMRADSKFTEADITTVMKATGNDKIKSRKILNELNKRPDKGVHRKDNWMSDLDESSGGIYVLSPFLPVNEDDPEYTFKVGKASHFNSRIPSYNTAHFKGVNVLFVGEVPLRHLANESRMDYAQRRLTFLNKPEKALVELFVSHGFKKTQSEWKPSHIQMEWITGPFNKIYYVLEEWMLTGGDDWMPKKSGCFIMDEDLPTQEEYAKTMFKGKKG